MNDWLPDALNIRSVRIDRYVLRKILDTLDHSAGNVDHNKRRHRRLQYRGRQVILRTNQTGREIAFVVPTRNISCGGMSFLHGQMMHVGQSCSVDLATKNGSWVSIEGVVVRCRHIRGMIHEIGMKFQKPLDLASLHDLDDETVVEVLPADVQIDEPEQQF